MNYTKTLSAIALITMMVFTIGCKPENNEEPDNPNSVIPEGNYEVPTGGIVGLFTVSPNQQVFFSQGNLQYQASNKVWRFAENQWNFVGSANPDDNSMPCGNVSGSDNCFVSETYGGWIDLFSWGTSGWNSGANCYQPYSLSYNDSDFYPGGSEEANLTGDYAKADWGVYNAIQNGGNQAGMWRTLTNDEWRYVVNTRATLTGMRYAKATVNGVIGLLLLPDYWKEETYALNNTNDYIALFDCNIIEANAWANILEPAGVVFLPAAGNREYTSVYSIGLAGYYTSATKEAGTFGLYFGSSMINAGNGAGSPARALSVRLVHNAY